MNIIMLVFISIVIIILMEHLYKYYKWKTSFRNIYKKSKVKELSYEYKTNFTIKYKGENYNKYIEYHTNRYGQRNPDYDIKRNDKDNIIVVGDSIPFGFGVEEKYTFSRYLERELKPQHNNIRVINAAVGTYNIIKYYFYIKIKVKLYKPKLILLCLNLTNLVKSNDWIFDDKKNYVRFKYPKKVKFKSKTLGPFRGYFSKVGRFIDKIYLYRFFIRPRLNKMLISREKSNLVGNTDQLIKYINIFKSSSASGVASRLNYLQKIREECKKLNVEFITLIFPLTAQLENNIPSKNVPQKTVVNYCNKNNIKTIDILDAFSNQREAPNSQLYYFDELHLTKKGHKRVAEYIKPFVTNYIISS